MSKSEVVHYIYLCFLFSNDIYLTCTCTCMLMSREAVALNADILLPKLVKSVVESVDGRCFNDMLRKLIPVRHDSLAEEHLTDTKTLWLKNI